MQVNDENSFRVDLYRKYTMDQELSEYKRKIVISQHLKEETLGTM